MLVCTRMYAFGVSRCANGVEITRAITMIVSGWRGPRFAALLEMCSFTVYCFTRHFLA